MNKLITVESFKQIIPLGGMQGPILTPFRCSIEKIRIMVVLGNKVVEHGPNGESVKLTLDNYANNNFKTKQNKNDFTPKPVVDKQPIKQEVKAEPVMEEAKKEEVVKQEQPRNEQKNNNGKDFRKNK